MWSRKTDVIGSGRLCFRAATDIDHFKQFNDAYGHQAGDVCVRAVAEVLEASIRRPGDQVARYGGEEFAFILPATDLLGARKLGAMVCMDVRDMRLPLDSGKAKPNVTVSVGVTAYVPETDVGFEALIAAADKALYEAKETGRDRVIWRQVAV